MNWTEYKKWVEEGHEEILLFLNQEKHGNGFVKSRPDGKSTNFVLHLYYIFGQ